MMKRHIRYILFAILLTACNILYAQVYAPPTPGSGEQSNNTYASTSVLKSGTWLKVRVSKSGLHRLPFEVLRKNGIEPENAHVFGYGGAMISEDFSKQQIDDLPEVNSYISDNSLIFYAQGPISWEWTGTRFHHTVNPYSRYGYYFVTSDNGDGKRIVPQTSPITNFEVSTNSFLDYQLHEIDTVNLVDRSGKAGGGRDFYGETLGDNHSLKITFSFPNLIAEKNMSLMTHAAALSLNQSMFNISLNDQQVQSLTIAAKPNDNYVRGVESSRINNKIKSDGDEKQVLTITYIANNSSAFGFLDYVELSGYRQLKMADDILYFSCPEHIGSYSTKQYILKGANANTHVWNITNPLNAYEMQTTIEGDELKFVADNTSLQRFVAVNVTNASIPEVEVVGTISNQNLHSLENIEYVVITNELFLTQAQALAQAHAQYEGLTTAVVTDQEVYNEFSSGTPDASAYRRLMKMLYDRAIRNNGIAPRYLQLVGDGTFDNRKILRTSGNNYLLTYQAINSTNETQAYSTDDYFCYLDDSNGMTFMSNTMNISVGRLPVNSVADAEGLVNKLIKYISNETYGNWKNQLLFLADDGDNTAHVRCADTAAIIVAQNNPNFNINKIYLDAYQQEVSASGESYPLAKNKLENLLNKGVLFFNYCGHAGYTNITNEIVLHVNDIRKMENANQGFWLFATCNFSQYDAQAVSAGEESVLNPNGGAISMLSSCRTVYASDNEVLNRYICEALFANQKNNPSYTNTIGDAIRLGKNQQTYTDNKLPYILLGDPALRLHYPTDYKVEVTSINDKDMNVQDTLRAVSINTLKGLITDKDGATADDFSGKIQITIFDKMQRISTNDNDQTDPQKVKHYIFRDYPNTLFNGEVDVVNGRWESTFMMPKDIKYNYGLGHIVFYAYDKTNGYEANGWCDNFVVGGSSDILTNDNEGPQITLYMENREFQDGGNVNERPHFYADIYDENGINTVGSGIGHDLLLTIDSDPMQTYIMNDYFTSENNSYQAGQISYRLSTLSDGQHHLTLRAWDLLNNSSTASLNFGVVTGLDPVIFSVLTYPNPVSNSGIVHFDVSHDRPDAVLYTQIEMFDMSGRKVVSYTQQGADGISLSMSDLNVTSGIFIYQIKIRTEQSEYVFLSDR